MKKLIWWKKILKIVKIRHNPGLWFRFIFLVFLLTGCESVSSTPATTQIAHFVPPTSDPGAGQVPVLLPTPLPTRQVNCVNQLQFLDDLTFPDGTEVLPGQKIKKHWLITNDGSCNWDQSYSLQLISGLALGAGKIWQLYPARQSSEAILEIVFTAPDNPGHYNTWWQAYDPDGNRFGDPVYMEISVVEELSGDG